MLIYMHLSDPSRDKVSKGSMANGSLSSRAGRTDDCNCYCGGWFARDASLEMSTQFVPTRSGILSFGGMWMAPLSWHAVRLGLRWHYTGPGLPPRKTVLVGLPDLP